MTDEDIISQFKDKNGNIKAIWKRLLTDEISQYLLNRYSDSLSLRESLYRIIYNISSRPSCKYCGNSVKFNGDSFSTYCCNSCQAKDCQHKREQTMLSKYGTISQFGRKEVQERIKHVVIDKYSTENVFSNSQIREKAKRTKLERYGDENYNNTEKFHATCLSKYGVTAPAKNKEIREKQRITCFNKYGGWWNKQQVSLTMNEKHNVNWYTQSDNIKLCNNTIEAKQKQYETKKKNHSFNSSKTEDESCVLLKQKYNDVICQYRSDLYPFNCDFYIPSLDLYIECNYHWTHGGHPYNEETDHIKLLEWQEKSKTSTFYTNAIHTWTERDVIKRETAKQNKLKYIEFWNITELQNWLNF